DPARRDGPPRALPAVDDPGVRLRRQLRPAHPGTAARRAQPHLPRLDMSTEGRLHSWDVSTGVDGPGTRFVAFLAGCPLRCLYCQNPDTWRQRDGTPTTAEA